MADFDNFDGTAIDRGQPIYAGFFPRLGAGVIDFLVLVPLIGASTYFTVFSPNFLAYSVLILIGFCYGPIMDSTAGGTVGKMALKQRVVDEHGRRITLVQGVTRAAPWIIGGLAAFYAQYQVFQIPGLEDADGFMEYSMTIAAYQAESNSLVTQWLPQLSWILPLLSSLVMFGTDRNQGAHDILAETFVVKKQEQY